MAIINTIDDGVFLSSLLKQKNNVSVVLNNLQGAMLNCKVFFFRLLFYYVHLNYECQH